MSPSESGPPPRRRGRPADVDPEHVALLALRHFVENGYETTTMDDIAALAGIGRRTLFRYFSSKPALVWGGMQPVVGRMHEVLDAAPRDESVRDALMRATEHALDLTPEAQEATRLRLRLMASDPALVGFGLTRLGEDSGILAEFLARRLGIPAAGLRARVLANALASANFTALLWWAENDDGPPAVIAVEAIGEILNGLE